jgi:predicted nuclease of predicted toxin-antitoxin system
MRILFDQGTPVPLRRVLTGHEIDTAFDRGWQMLKNGDLLVAAESAGFDVFITTDRNLQYQQNLAGRRLAILVLPTTDWRRIRNHVEVVATGIAALTPGAYLELSFPTE